MVPEILYRVCHNSETPKASLIAHLRSTPALLHDYSRRKVRYADFPGIIPQAAHCVLGTLVGGLSDRDVARLDDFEGSMYRREVVQVQALDAEVFDADGVVREAEMQKVRGMGEGERRMVQAETYVWCIGEDDLEKDEWLYADFRKEKLRSWVDGPRDDSDGAGEKVGEENGKGDEAEVTKKKEKGGQEVGEEEEEEEDEEREKQRIASVIARIVAEETHARETEEAEMLRSAV